MKKEIKCLCNELVNESYYLNKCHSGNKIGEEKTQGGYETTHLVDDKKVVLSYNQYSNGDDIDDELVSVEISPIKSLLDNLVESININPWDLLGKKNEAK